MQRILSTQLSTHVGETVRVAGWIHRRRMLKSVAFLILRDAEGLTQIVVSDESVRAQLEALPEETTVSVVGFVTAQPSAPGGIEITEPVITALTDPAEPAPFDLYRPELRASLPTMLDHATVALRHPRFAATHRIAAAAVGGFRTAMTGMSFVEINTPKIVGAATQSGANVFGLDYFGRPAYLAQSPQSRQADDGRRVERVFETGPVFRAEPTTPSRHLASSSVLLDARDWGSSKTTRRDAACHAADRGMVLRHVRERRAIGRPHEAWSRPKITRSR